MTGSYFCFCDEATDEAEEKMVVIRAPVVDVGCVRGDEEGAEWGGGPMTGSD